MMPTAFPPFLVGDVEPLVGDPSDPHVGTEDKPVGLYRDSDFTFVTRSLREPDIVPLAHVAPMPPNLLPHMLFSACR